MKNGETAKSQPIPHACILAKLMKPAVQKGGQVEYTGMVMVQQSTTFIPTLGRAGVPERGWWRWGAVGVGVCHK